MATKYHPYKISNWDGDPHRVGDSLGYVGAKSPKDAIRKYKRDNTWAKKLVAERITIEGFKINLEKLANSK